MSKVTRISNAGKRSPARRILENQIAETKQIINSMTKPIGHTNPWGKVLALAESRKIKGWRTVKELYRRLKLSPKEALAAETSRLEHLNLNNSQARRTASQNLAKRK